MFLSGTGSLPVRYPQRVRGVTCSILEGCPKCHWEIHGARWGHSLGV